jgi:hypothetical protein
MQMMPSNGMEKIYVQQPLPLSVSQVLASCQSVSGETEKYLHPAL